MVPLPPLNATEVPFVAQAAALLLLGRGNELSGTEDCSSELEPRSSVPLS